MTVNLRKGEKVSLLKTSENHLNHVFMGLGWDARRHGLFDKLLGRDKEIDLDASCILFDEDGDPVDVVFYNHLKSSHGEIFHSGDNRTGISTGPADDEVIHVYLDRIPRDIKYLAFTVTSYEGQNFNNIENAYCRLVDLEQSKELVRFNISGGGEHLALLMAILYRNNGAWEFRAVGSPYNFNNPINMTPACMLELKYMIQRGELN